MDNITISLYNRAIGRDSESGHQERHIRAGRDAEMTRGKQPQSPPPPALHTTTGSERPERNSMSTIELTRKIKELRELQALIEEAQAEAEAIKDALKAHMGESEELRAGEYKITWKTVTTARLDGKALRAALPDVAARFTRETTSRRFTVA